MIGYIKQLINNNKKKSLIKTLDAISFNAFVVQQEINFKGIRDLIEICATKKPLYNYTPYRFRDQYASSQLKITKRLGIQVSKNILLKDVMYEIDINHDFAFELPDFSHRDDSCGWCVGIQVMKGSYKINLKNNQTIYIYDARTSKNGYLASTNQYDLIILVYVGYDSEKDEQVWRPLELEGIVLIG